MAEGVLEREYIHSSSYRLRGMAVPQLVRVNVEASGSSPLPANISNRLSSEVSLSSGTRKYIAVSFAAAAAKLTAMYFRVPEERDTSLDKRLEMFAGSGDEPLASTFTRTN